MSEIIPLSNELLKEAISLVKTIFPDRRDQKLARYSLPDSLEAAHYSQTYWVAVNEKRQVIGITGLYNDRNDRTIVWLGWYGVLPSYRKQGIGSELLRYAIDQAKRRGAARLKLYTSSDSNEGDAHKLYRKFGFIQVGLDKSADKIYYQKDITI